MPFAENFMLTGVTSAVQTSSLPAQIQINTGFLPTRIELINLTKYGVSGTPQNVQTALWTPASTNTFVQYNLTTTSTLASAAVANGISLYDGRQSVRLGPVIAASGITAANPAVITTGSAHGLFPGDKVLLSGMDIMKQLGNIVFTVTSTPSATTFSINVNTSIAPFAAQVNAFSVRKVIVGPLFYPNAMAITSISSTNPIQVFTAVAHNLTPGQQVRLRVPAAFGMPQANNISAVITSTPTNLSFILGSVDASAFSAFVWPPGGGAFAAFTPAQVIPEGAGPSPVITPPFWFDDKLDDAETNIQFQGFTIGSGLLQLGTASVVGVQVNDQFAWTAWRGDV